MFARMAVVATAVIGALFLVVGLLAVGPATADHGEGHNGETMEVSNAVDLVDGEVITVTLTSFVPGNTVNLVTCYIYPALGPTDCNLANFGQHEAEVAADGTATIDYKVDLIVGSCDQDNPCFIVAADGFGSDANYAAQQVTFAAAQATNDDAEADEDAEQTTEDAVDETAEDDAAPDEVEETPDEVDEATENSITEDSATEDNATEDEVTQDEVDEVDEADSGDDASDSGSNFVIPLAMGAVALGLVGAFLSRRNRN